MPDFPIPVAGLPRECNFCGTRPGAWLITPYGGFVCVTCPACYTAAGNLVAVAPEQRVSEAVAEMERDVDRASTLAHEAVAAANAMLYGNDHHPQRPVIRLPAGEDEGDE